MPVAISEIIKLIKPYVSDVFPRSTMNINCWEDRVDISWDGFSKEFMSRKDIDDCECDEVRLIERAVLRALNLSRIPASE